MSQVGADPDANRYEKIKVSILYYVNFINEKINFKCKTLKINYIKIVL